VRVCFRTLWTTACFTQKFGYGNVVKIDGNKLTIAFEKAGEKKVVDSFVERA
jgi:DNA helicase-2/ATP-dependent DNA helicase PcrA